VRRLAAVHLQGLQGVRHPQGVVAAPGGRGDQHGCVDSVATSLPTHHSLTHSLTHSIILYVQVPCLILPLASVTFAMRISSSLTREVSGVVEYCLTFVVVFLICPFMTSSWAAEHGHQWHSHQRVTVLHLFRSLPGEFACLSCVCVCMYACMHVCVFVCVCVVSK
jgi:hypothetical protein